MAKKPARSTANDATSSNAPPVAKPRATRAKLNSTATGSGLSAVGGPEKISDALPPQDDGFQEERVRQAPGDALVARRLGDPTDEDIRARAYEMYLERGGQHGLDFDDWVRAERELRRKP
jgi:hypothetical protein